LFPIHVIKILGRKRSEALLDFHILHAALIKKLRTAHGKTCALHDEHKLEVKLMNRVHYSWKGGKHAYEILAHLGTKI
jgi:hypothetical protein